MLTRNAPSEAALARFLDDFTALGLGGADVSVGICVSGGSDSVALLLLAQGALRDVEAATVDHGLRPASAGEAAFAARLCGQLGVAHETLKLGELPAGNVSAEAREARYDALRHWAGRRGRRALLTAHHADDQLETVIMRLNRGSGVAGLAGIRDHNGMIARPLLGWRREELAAVVAACGVVPVDDPTNRDDRFDRARLRKALAGADWLDPLAAARSAAALAEAEQALDWAAAQAARTRLSEADGAISLDPEGLPREIVRRLLLICLRQARPDADPRGGAFDRLIATMEAGGTTTLAGVLCIGGTRWSFRAAPPRRGG